MPTSTHPDRPSKRESKRGEHAGCQPTAKMSTSEHEFMTSQLESSRRKTRKLPYSASFSRIALHSDERNHHPPMRGGQSMSPVSGRRQVRPLELTVQGWAGTVWTPAKFPGQIMGMTDRQVHLIQKIHTLNLRSPDLLNIIR
eukprot:GEMP01062827.1.p1 GENE.GEMP01062827.1~~GEMP01062827.1.p1  ORF type:complete len:142 (+),score=20.44 GEMP01062827.1:106-531(+)